MYYEINAEEGDVFRSRYTCETSGLSTTRQCAVEAAEDYCRNHDGWELDWPVVVTLFDGPEGQAIGKYEVAQEAVPGFWCIGEVT
jgi:hypothetical protein